MKWNEMKWNEMKWNEMIEKVNLNKEAIYERLSDLNKKKKQKQKKRKIDTIL
jgi:hypothetical protein